MKAVFTISFGVAAAAVLLAGCASPESGRVSYNENGTKVYALNDQPQSAVVGQGTLMPHAYESHLAPTGQFTGQDHLSVGPQPVTPGEADPRDQSRAPQTETDVIVPAITPGGAGSLGQIGVQPANRVSNSTSMTEPGYVPPAATTAPATSTVNPAKLNNAPTPAEPSTGLKDQLDNTQQQGKENGEGNSPGAESSTGQGRTPPSREPVVATPNIGQGALKAMIDDLPERIRQHFSVSRPDSTIHLSPDELRQFQVEAVNGNVTLHGVVSSELEKKMIGENVSRMTGVRSVNNQLRVVNPAQERVEGRQTRQP
jgi:hypothetical protein